MSMGPNNYRVRFNKDDPFLRELRSTLLAEMVEKDDHLYANKWDYLKAGLYIISLGTSYYFFLTETHLALKVMLTLAVMFSGMLLVAGIVHDASHNRFFKSRKLNKAILRPLFIVAGLDGRLWGLRHVRSHHPMTNISGSDCDTNQSDFIRMSERQPWLPHHQFQKYYVYLLYLLIFPHAVWYEDFGHLDEKHIKAMTCYKVSPFERFQFYLSKLMHLSFWVIIPTLVTNFSLLANLGFYAIAMGFASFLFVCIAVLNHYSVGIPFPEADENRKMNVPYSLHQIRVNVDWEGDNHICTYIFGGANTHVAHHILTDFHSRHLTRATEIIQEISPKYEGYRYTGYSFWGAVKAHFTYIAKLGENPVPQEQEINIFKRLLRIIT